MSGADFVDPIAIFLATSGTKGERLAFRFPFERSHARKTRGVNPYALLPNDDEDMNFESRRKKSHRASSLVLDDSGYSSGTIKLRKFSNKMLANMFAYVKSAMLNEKFEVKVDDVIFVGHPQSIPSTIVKSTETVQAKGTLDTPPRSASVSGSSLSMFHIVFAMEAEQATEFVVRSYHTLSMQLAAGICYEEVRRGYLTANLKEMTTISEHEQDHLDGEVPKSPFASILERNHLAQMLRTIFDDLSRNGWIRVRINDWIQVTHCLLPKIHRDPSLTETSLLSRIHCMRPYHGLLLLENEQQIIADLPVDSSPLLVRVIRMVTPLHNFQQLAMEAAATLAEIFAVAGHLIYWGRARLIFPVCETNVYAVSPTAQIRTMSELVDEFSLRFADLNLLEMLADFSMPQPIRDLINPFSDKIDVTRLTQVVIWCLRHKLLTQQHTYVYFIPDGDRVNASSWREEAQEKVSQLALSGGDEKELQHYQMLLRLIPYFNGEAHLEEMMFEVNIKRIDLMMILDKYREFLVTCTHEDRNLVTNDNEPA